MKYSRFREKIKFEFCVPLSKNSVFLSKKKSKTHSQ
jgi:hypothetical protein